MKKIIAKIILVVGILLCLLPMGAGIAYAGETMPWDTGLRTLTNALSGTTAMYVTMMGLFFIGAMLMFGGDLGNFGKSLMMVVIVGTLLGGIGQVAGLLGFSSGALLP